jgi:hypothetical protein
MFGVVYYLTVHVVVDLVLICKVLLFVIEVQCRLVVSSESLIMLIVSLLFTDTVESVSQQG